MKKTTLISILVVAVQLGIAVIAEAQQAGKVPRLGYVSVRGASSQAPVLEAFRQGLRELGYILPVEQPTKFDLDQLESGPNRST
jgi:hypothetical protein